MLVVIVMGTKVFVVIWEPLVKCVQKTQEYVDAFDYERLAAEVKDMVSTTCTVLEPTAWLSNVTDWHA